MVEELDNGFGDEIDLTGSVLEKRYRVLRRLGAGGMGSVYHGQHVMLGTDVAIKVLQPRYAYDPEWVQRFLLEARAASRIRHPHIVQIFDFDAPRRGLVFMVMELLEGESLAELCNREGPLPWPRVARFAEQVADALAAAHARGIVHRDIKPANCFRVSGQDDPNFVKVLDFGIAKFLGGADEDCLSPSTATGMWMGTPEYMAPEIFQGRRPDTRADIYSLGVLMYKLLTGRVPFTGHHLLIAQQAVFSEVPAPSQVAPASVVIAPEVDALILHALNRDPDKRTSSMTELLAGLRASRGGGSIDLPAAAPRLSPVLTHDPGFVEASTLRRELPPVAPVEDPITEVKQPALPSEITTPSAIVIGRPLEKPRRSRWWLGAGSLTLAALLGVAIVAIVNPFAPHGAADTRADAPRHVPPSTLNPEPPRLVSERASVLNEPVIPPQDVTSPTLPKPQNPDEPAPVEITATPVARKRDRKPATTKLASVRPEEAPPNPEQSRIEQPEPSPPQPTPLPPRDPEPGIQARAGACRRAHNAEGGPLITVVYSVESDGTVASAEASVSGTLGNCLVRAVREAQFEPKTQRNLKLKL